MGTFPTMTRAAKTCILPGASRNRPERREESSEDNDAAHVSASDARDEPRDNMVPSDQPLVAIRRSGPHLEHPSPHHVPHHHSHSRGSTRKRKPISRQDTFFEQRAVFLCIIGNSGHFPVSRGSRRMNGMAPISPMAVMIGNRNPPAI